MAEPATSSGTTKTTAESWAGRVAQWRSSGLRAEEFSRHAGYAASTLRWWASKLQREPVPAAPEVRLARVVRASPPALVVPARGAAIVVESLHAGVRIVVAPDADRATLAMVLETLGIGAAA